MKFLLYEAMVPTPDSGALTLRSVVEDLESLGVRRVHSVAWRDLDDPEAGGSEVHADNIFRRWAESGLQIQHRTSTYDVPRDFRRHGYEVRQCGGRYGVFPREIVRQFLTPHQYDAVVEIWNGVPWFSSLWSRRPHVTWMHHIHTDMWRESLPTMIAPLGPVLETRMAPPFYKRSPLITLAEPTREQLLSHGYDPSLVHVVPPGISREFVPATGAQSSGEIRLVAVGRLAPVKQFDDLIKIVARLVTHLPSVHLAIIGEGPERSKLESLIHELALERHVTLVGRVPQDLLVKTYQESTLLVSASHSEGWGMTITEAAACGTPSVVLDNDGHRAAVEHGVSGVVVPDLNSMTNEILRIVNSQETRSDLARGAVKRAATYTWDNAALRSLTILRDEVARRRAKK